MEHRVKHNKHKNKRSSNIKWPYEHHTEPLISPGAFAFRLAAHGGFAFALVVVSLGLGALGYHFSERMPWIDAFLNASMILSGMGQVNELHTSGGKLFASFYSLFSGVVFLVAVGIIFAPLVHRLLHRLHLESDGMDQ